MKEWPDLPLGPCGLLSFELMPCRPAGRSEEQE